MSGGIACENMDGRLTEYCTHLVDENATMRRSAETECKSRARQNQGDKGVDGQNQRLLSDEKCCWNCTKVDDDKSYKERGEATTRR